MPEEETRMVDRPQTHLNGTFDPDYVATLRKILDIAVEQIALENRTPATKAKMAQTIVSRAANGITDASDLVSSAVRAGETRAA
jgi:SUMO ligase MMS21 Smc5/6 complex component